MAEEVGRPRRPWRPRPGLILTGVAGRQLSCRSPLRPATKATQKPGMLDAYLPPPIRPAYQTLERRPVTAATGLKRLAIAVATMIAAAFVTLVALSFLIPAATVRDAVDQAKSTPSPGSIRCCAATISISLFPSGTVTFHNVVLGNDPNGAAGRGRRRVDRASALFPAARGADRDRRRDPGAADDQRQLPARRRVRTGRA